MSDPSWHWLVLGISITALLALDLYVHRDGRHTSERAAVTWSVVWIGAGLLFSVVPFTMSTRHGEEYLAAYAMEKSLSLDNMFVFLLIFKSLRVPIQHQHTALAWGIFGALIFRALFIFLGASALEHWDWLRYAFGALLLIAAWHALHENLGKRRESRLLGWLSKHLRVSQDSESNRFWVREQGKWQATPLLLALAAIELSDVVFAVDSVPAALSISRNRFVVYSSNAFAILGLRALYLAVEAYLMRSPYLNFGISAILCFAAVKLMAGEALPIHPLISVAVIIICLSSAFLAGTISRRRASMAR